MPWFYVDDGFSDSKPIMNLPTTRVRVPMRIAAAGAWVLAGSWSAKEETDGYVPYAKLKSLMVPKSVVDALCDPGPLDAALWCPQDGQILAKNWSKWQPTKAENDAKRKRAAERKKDQRRRGRTFVTGIDDQMSHCDTGVDSEGSSKFVSQGVSQCPDPIPTLISQVGWGSPVGGGAGLPRPRSRFCDDHPDGTTTRCGPCGDARRAFDAAEAAEQAGTIAAAAEQAAQRRAIRAAIDACEMCDDLGRLDDLSPCPGHPRIGGMA